MSHHILGQARKGLPGFQLILFDSGAAGGNSPKQLSRMMDTNAPKIFDDNQYRIVTTAEGYLELNMPAEAHEELMYAHSAFLATPTVLLLKIEIYRAMHQWPAMQNTAERLLENEPHNVARWILCAEAIALNDSMRTQEDSFRMAILLLGCGLNRFAVIPGLSCPENAALHLEIARYRFELGEIDLVRVNFAFAFNADRSARPLDTDSSEFRELWYRVNTPVAFRTAQ